MRPTIDLSSNAVEYLPMENTYSPIYHRLNQVTKYRAIHPDSPVPPPPDALIKPSKPPDELLEKAKSYLQELREAANVKHG